MGRTTYLEKKALNYNLDDALVYLNESLEIRDSGAELQELITRKGISIKELKRKFKNLDNWLKGVNTPSREKAIELCFSLTLDITEADFFLTRTCGHEWFHLRDYKDLIYSVCLSNGWSFETAYKYIGKYEHLDIENPRDVRKAGSTRTTHKIKYQVDDVSTEDELCEYIEVNKERFGTYNSTAYDYFKEDVDLYRSKKVVYKEEGNDKNKEEKKDKFIRDEISIYEVCDDMRMGIPTGLKKKQSQLSPVQRALFDDVPDREIISDIYYRRHNKKTGRIPNVKRKWIILIWLLTITYCSDYNNFEGLVKIINIRLNNCGMPMLDSKNPFDWIVFNALKDGFERMEAIITSIFNNVDADEE